MSNGGLLNPSVLVGLHTISESNVRLWHQQLGYPSFSYLKFLYLQLFLNKDLSSFHCDHRVLTKHSRSPHPSRPYTPSCPFHLMHGDVWGPSRVSTITGKRWFVTFIDDHTRFVGFT